MAKSIRSTGVTHIALPAMAWKSLFRGHRGSTIKRWRFCAPARLHARLCHCLARHGIVPVETGEAWTTQTCVMCGIPIKMDIGRDKLCLCGHTIDRDVNGALGTLTFLKMQAPDQPVAKNPMLFDTVLVSGPPSFSFSFFLFLLSSGNHPFICDPEFRFFIGPSLCFPSLCFVLAMKQINPPRKEALFLRTTSTHRPQGQ